MIIACVFAMVAALIMPPRPGIRVGLKTPKNTLRIRAGPTTGSTAGQMLKKQADPLEIAADIELFAACLDAGLNTRDAASVVANVAVESQQQIWTQVVALLSVGVNAQKAFSLMATTPGLDELANLATISQRSGSALSTGCTQIAGSLRATAADHRTAAAERAGVFIALPLALCFLPAFIIIGLAPVVLSLGTQLITF
ncbi:type II secretion system F family protein [Corynebacterium callunae]|uniref:type II secretion system F family protein n=1 Tax=Corynebacterium callunae TaxID=1721 RepID=UPI0039829D9B